MSLEQKIETEFKQSMKQQDNIKLSTLRMMKAALNNLKLEINKNELTDEEIIKIIQRQVKQHRDSIEQFGKGNRQDLV